MIRDYNIANDANIQLHKILGATLGGQILTGELFWVGDSGDAAYDKMRSRVPAANMFTDLDVAVGACTASRGDIIICLEGFNQSVIAAGGLDLDVAGITIVFLGSGTSQAKITFGTDVAADMDVDAANITMIRPKFVAGIDSLTGPIDVNSTDFTIIDGEWHDATDIETTDCIIATSGATRLKIDGWKFFHGTETGDQKQSNIQLNGCDDVVLKNIDIRGDFFVGCIENVTDEVLNIRLKNIILDNLNATPKPALYLDANATGHAQNCHFRVASGTTFVSSVGLINWGADCLGFSTDGYAGDQIGTSAAGGIEAQVTTIASDLVVMDALIDTIKSDLIVADAIIDTITSDLVVTQSDVKVVISGLTIVESDVKVALSGLTIIESDLKITHSDVKVVLSGLTIVESDLKSFWAAWQTFETIMSDFVVKYESDNP